MADKLVEAGVISSLDSRNALWGPYWSDESIGVIVFVDDDGHISFARTINKGTNWATTEIHAGNAMQLACWYDKETPGNSGTLIHMAWLDYVDGAGNDKAYYRTLDVSDASLGTQRTVDTITVDAASAANRIAVTQTVSGNIIFAFCTQVDIECYKSADNFATGGTDIADVFEAATQEDWCLLFPAATADDDDACAMYWDITANEISLKVYDDSGDTWTEASIWGSMVEDGAHINMDGSVRHSDSCILVAAHSEDDDPGDDLKTSELTVDDPVAGNCTITAKTNVFTDQVESAQVSVFINQQNVSVRIAYFKGGFWTNTVDLVFHESVDGMANWGAEQAYSESTDDHRLCPAGRTVGDDGGRYQPSFYDDDQTDIYVNLNNDIEIAAAAAGFAYSQALII